jgi:hypothetical protein
MDTINCTNDRILSQVNMLNNGKSMFCSVGEEGRPGAIEIWKMPLEKI